MKLDLNKFYNSNYKDFVHKEALEEALRMVAEIDLKEVEIDSILSITFSVDEFGENPIYVEYLDKEGKKHIVRIRPAVTNEIQEILKRYVTLEQHETDKQDIYNHFEHMHVPMEIRSENELDEYGNKVIVLNNDNSYLSFQVDPETDNEIQWLCIHNKGGIGSQSMYFARFMDYAKVDQVPSNAEFLEKIQQLEELVQRKSQETLQSSKAYTDSQDDTLRAEITTNVTNQINETKNGILSYVDVEIDNLREYVDNRDAEYHELSKQYTDNVKQEAVNSCKTYTDNKTAETLETSKTYTDTKHTEVTQHVAELENDMNTNFATKQELLTNVESLSDIDQQNFDTLNERINIKATVYKKDVSDSVRYYFPQINVTTKTDGDIILEGKDETTVKLANLLNDEQLAKLKNFPETLPAPGVSEEQLNTKLNDYLLKNKIKYNDGDFSKINFVHGSNDSIQVHDTSGNLSMRGKFISDSQATKITNAENKLSEITGVATNITWYPTPNLHYIRLLDNDKYVTAHMNKEPAEVVTYLPKENLGKKIDTINSNKADKQTVDDLTQMIQTLATKGDNIEIGERTKVNFVLSNSNNGEPINPTITSNDSYYVKVGSQYIISVYLTFEIGVTPTSTQKTVAFSWSHDLPGENPPLTLTAELAGNRGIYSTTATVTTNRGRVSFAIPAFPATETYNGNKISIYGTAITKDLSKEAENNE